MQQIQFQSNKQQQQQMLQGNDISGRMQKSHDGTHQQTKTTNEIKLLIEKIEKYSSIVSVKNECGLGAKKFSFTFSFPHYMFILIYIFELYFF